MKVEETLAELSGEKVKLGFSASKSFEIEEMAKKLGIKLGRKESNDLEKVRKILSRGMHLSEIVREQRKA